MSIIHDSPIALRTRPMVVLGVPGKQKLIPKRAATIALLAIIAWGMAILLGLPPQPMAFALLGPALLLAVLVEATPRGKSIPAWLVVLIRHLRRPHQLRFARCMPLRATQTPTRRGRGRGWRGLP